MAQFELYSGTSVPTETNPGVVSVEDGMFEAHLDMTDQLAATLGLTGVQVLVKVARARYPVIVPADYKVWQEFLPMSYYDGPVRWDRKIDHALMMPDGEMAMPIADFDFDMPPIPILEAWASARKRKLFQGYLIRTPEDRKAFDPILVGVKDKRYYLIARWSEGALLTFEEIKAKVATIWEERAARRKNGIRCICGCGRVLPAELMRVKLAAYFPKDPGTWKSYGPTKQVGALHSECVERLFGVKVPESA